MLRMQDKKEKQEEKIIKSEINSECPCDEPCVRHGKCELCQDYHKKHLECGTTACGK